LYTINARSCRLSVVRRRHLGGAAAARRKRFVSDWRAVLGISGNNHQATRRFGGAISAAW